jgi:site-specific DNA-methyltransferase (adenine-specific)
MIGMAEYPDKYFDLAIVDPPYGLGNRLSDGGGKLKNTPMAVLYRKTNWEDIKPDSLYFTELFRVSKNQIICGANYFLEFLPSSRGVICWDKSNQCQL